jgi:hypothetical protein
MSVLAHVKIANGDRGGIIAWGQSSSGNVSRPRFSLEFFSDATPSSNDRLRVEGSTIDGDVSSILDYTVGSAIDGTFYSIGGSVDYINQVGDIYMDGARVATNASSFVNVGPTSSTDSNRNYMHREPNGDVGNCEIAEFVVFQAKPSENTVYDIHRYWEERFTP